MTTITCKTCGIANSILRTKCSGCGSILQGRIPNLNLFEVIWEIIEQPKKTFLKICLSEQKNYVYLLFSIIGIGFLFTKFWFNGIGQYYPNLLNLLIYGMVFGPVVGVLIFFIFTRCSYFIASKIFKTEVTRKNITAVTAYSFVPILFSTIFILTTKLIVFGIYLFTTYPSPQYIKPEVFYILSALDILCLLYTMFLFFIGILVSSNASIFKSVFITFTLLVFFALIIFLFLMV
jgi:hypothetical protein